MADRQSKSDDTSALTAREFQSKILSDAYNIRLYISLAEQYLHLAYPDLACGAAYKALLLADAADDESDEYHHVVVDSLQNSSETEEPSATVANGSDRKDSSPIQHVVHQQCLPSIYRILIRSLLSCGCCQSAATYCSQARKRLPNHAGFESLSREIDQAVADRLGVEVGSLAAGEHSNPASWPEGGLVRREIYPWNVFEPDRLRELDTLNAMMSAVAPNLEVKAVELPNLFKSATGDDSTVNSQLGVFAKCDLLPGQMILKETSLLTANNKLQDALCDACSGELPALGDAAADSTISCPDCEVVFCSEQCYQQAIESYHPALCDRDVESIAKDVSPTKASDSLYSLLLLRALAMAETQQCHPLELKEVKYIWGDFHPVKDRTSRSNEDSKTLPFTFEHNIRLPFHMLEKMDIDIFAQPQYDVWVFNTLYAKFRGTASARLSGLGGRRARGPEVSAVHPMWCLANHSCDPNVSWNWGGSIEFRVLGERAEWQKVDGGRRGGEMSAPGIKKGEEVLNHYCDITLPVKERREWARGALGGDCRCARCVWEAGG